MRSWCITYWRDAGQLLANFFPVPSNSLVFSFQERQINSTEGVKCNYSKRTTSQALTTEPKLGRLSHTRFPGKFLGTLWLGLLWLGLLWLLGVWGLHSRFKYNQFWNLLWKYELITWTCSTLGFFIFKKQAPRHQWTPHNN